MNVQDHDFYIYDFALYLISAILGNALSKTFSIRQVSITGTVIATVSFVAASFATQVWHLYITFAVAGMFVWDF